MSYIPKTVKCRMNFKNITDEEIRKSCACDSEISAVKSFYKKLDGAVLILSLWNYDNHETYHLTSWEDNMDNVVMEAMFILEKEFGVYSDFEEFKKVWKEGEYDSGGVTVFPKNCVEELEIICEESNELTAKEKLSLINSIEIIDYSCSGGECEYVLVEDNNINKEILHKIGLTDEEIDEECTPEGGYLDISPIAWKYANYFNGKNKRFSDVPYNPNYY